MRLAFTLACVLLTPALAAQDPFAPPKELDRYEPLLGSWEGAGTVSSEAGEEGSWTSMSHVRRVMNGHFVRSDTRIDIAGPQPFSLGFITHWGFDPERQRHVAYEVSNMGTVTESEVVWLDDDTMLSMMATQAMGQHTVERWITHLKGDTQEFVGEQAVAEGPWHVHVKGTTQKLAEETPVTVEDLPAFMATPSRQMKAALRMAGSYRIEGAYRMMADAELMEFAGTEVAKPLFGGLILQFASEGQPGDYEGLNFMGYDAGAGHFKMLGMSNMGPGHASQCWQVGDDWVMSALGPFQGTPLVSQVVMRVDAEGRLESASGHTILGAADPFVSFRATYTRQQDGE